VKAGKIIGSYFRKRRYFRIILLVLILGFWVSTEITERKPTEEDLNFKAIQEIQKNYKGGDFSFIVLGDNKNSFFFNKIIERINQEKDILFVINCGDLVMYPTNENYRAFLDQKKLIKFPNLVLPGNHDVAFDNYYLYYKIFGRFYYSFEVDGAKFIVIDDSNEQKISDEQFDWLEKELKNAQHYKYKFVFMHIPLWDPRDIGNKNAAYLHGLSDAGFAKRLEELFKKYNVTIIFEGHIHGYYDYVKNGLRHIVTGGGGAELTGTSNESNIHHYIRVDVKNGKVNTTMVKIDKGMLDVGTAKIIKKILFYSSTYSKIYYKQVLLWLLIAILLADLYLDYLTYKNRSVDTK
jgi:predicted phosphodiesterase